MGERGELPKTQRVRGWETFVDLTTRGSSVVKSTCILRWPRVPTSASVPSPLSNILVSRTHTHKSRTQDAPAFRTGGGGLKIFDDRSTLPTHPMPKLSCIMAVVYVIHCKLPSHCVCVLVNCRPSRNLFCYVSYTWSRSYKKTWSSIFLCASWYCVSRCVWLPQGKAASATDTITLAQSAGLNHVRRRSTCWG